MGEIMAKRKTIKKLEEEHYYFFNIGWANDFEVNICITPDVMKSRKHRDELLGQLRPRCENACALFCALEGKGWLFLPMEFDPDTVAHETYHLVDYMMDRLGVEHRDGEVMAYHMGYVVGKISEVYVRVKAEAKKKFAKELDKLIKPVAS
jgi:hypothetical protein